PAVAIDCAANGGTELLDEEILIRCRPSRRLRNARQGDAAAPEVELDAELLQQMRAEEKVDSEFFPAGDEELHLVVRHHRHRDVCDAHPAEIEFFQNAEVNGN